MLAVRTVLEGTTVAVMAPLVSAETAPPSSVTWSAFAGGVAGVVSTVIAVFALCTARRQAGIAKQALRTANREADTAELALRTAQKVERSQRLTAWRSVIAEYEGRASLNANVGPGDLRVNVVLARVNALHECCIQAKAALSESGDAERLLKRMDEANQEFLQVFRRGGRDLAEETWTIDADEDLRKGLTKWRSRSRECLQSFKDAKIE
jgi:hypothetical protein